MNTNETPSEWRSALLTTFLISAGIGIVGTHALCSARVLPPYSVVIGALITGLALLSYTHSSNSVKPGFWVWGILAVMHLLLIIQEPLLSGDLWRYLFDGQLQAHGILPWSYAPASPKVLDITQTIEGSINHPEVRSVYPSFAQILFGINAWVGGGMIAWKTLMFSCLILLTRILIQQYSWQVAFFVFGHPLSFLAVSSEAHIDIVGALLLGLVLWSSRSHIQRGIALGLAIATKFVPLILIPTTFTRARPRRAAFVIAVVATLCLTAIPYLNAGTGILGTLGNYAQHWTYNGSLAPVATRGLEAIVSSFTTNDTFTIGIFTDFRATLGIIDIYHGVPTHQSWWTAAELANFVYRVIAGCTIVVVAVVACRIREADISIACVLCAWLMLSPTVHPWYMVWLLPLMGIGGGFGIVLRVGSIAILLGYLTPALHLSTGEWTEYGWVTAIEYGSILLTAVIVMLMSRFERSSFIEDEGA